MRNIEGAPFHVDLDKKTCRYCEFQLLSIPCSHDVIVAMRAKVRVDLVVAIEYNTTYWKKAYESDITPVNKFRTVADVADGLSELGIHQGGLERPEYSFEERYGYVKICPSNAIVNRKYIYLPVTYILMFRIVLRGA